MTEAVLYVVLFLALYFQVFALLTFLSRDARLRREKARLETGLPHVAVIVPCYNEESTVGKTVASLLALDYPRERFEVILVNDGSTDNTANIMDKYAGTPGVTVLHKENGGKHTALNMGLTKTSAEFVGCLDADSFVHPGALREIVSHFDEARVAAVTASMTVHEPKTILESMQYAEYLAGVALRHILSAVNGLYVTPGPFSFYRRSTIEKIGGFREGHKTEDMEMAMRLQRAGYTIGNAPRAQVFTKAPRTVRGLLKQRTRWTTGFMRNAYDYRAMFFNPRYGVLGFLVLPFGVLAIAASLGLFAFTIYLTVAKTAEFIAMKGDVPLSYAMSLPSLDWFYVPLSGVLLLSIIGLSAVVLTMHLGRTIAHIERPLGFDVLWYIALYSLIAPFWLLRSTRDVALGYRRSWR